MMIGRPVIVSVRHIVTTMSAQSSLSAGFFIPLALRCGPRFALLRSLGGAVMSAHGVQHDHRDLALGLLLVIGVGRPELQRLFPQPRALLARGGPRPRLEFRGTDLHVVLRVG